MTAIYRPQTLAGMIGQDGHPSSQGARRCRERYAVFAAVVGR